MGIANVWPNSRNGTSSHDYLLRRIKQKNKERRIVGGRFKAIIPP